MKKNALIVITRFPFPSYGGDKIRILSIIDRLKEKYKVHLCFVGFSLKKQKAFKFLKIYINIISYKNILKIFFFYLYKKPFQTELYFSNQIYKSLKKKFQNTVFEIGYFHMIRTSEYADCFKIKKLYLDNTDSLVFNYRSIIKNINFIIVNYFFKIEITKIINYYNLISTKFNSFLYISKNDANFDKKILNKKIKFKIFNYNKSQISKKNLYNPNSNNILILGNFTSIANLFMAYQSIKIITELNNKYQQNFNLYLCGFNDFKIKIIYYFLGRNKNINIINNYKYLYQNKVSFFLSLANLAISSGFQNKILDYKQFNLPIICSNNVYKNIPKKMLKKVYYYKSKKNLIRMILNFKKKYR
jgi:hypothetical protein